MDDAGQLVERRPVVLIGGGGHALVVADAVGEAADLVGFFDDDAAAPLGVRLGLRRLGAIGDLPDQPDQPGPHIHLAIGNLAVRASLLAKLTGHQTFTVRHATAWVSEHASVGRGVFVGPQAVVHTAAVVGDYTIVNSGAIVEHECEIEANVHLAPGSVLGGNVRVGTGTLVGLGARVLPGVRIGRGCVVGAGATVTRHVPDGARVVGVPARALPAS